MPSQPAPNASSATASGTPRPVPQQSVLVQLVHWVQALIGYVIAFFMNKPVVPPPSLPAVKPLSRSGSSGSKLSSTGSTEKKKIGRGGIRRVSDKEVREYFEKYDTDKNNVITRDEFDAAANELLRTDQNEPLGLTKEQFGQIFGVLDGNNDGGVDLHEFAVCWNACILPISHPKVALIVVDVQNDFISGSLALIHCPAKDDGAKVVPVINKLRQQVEFDMVVFTLDAHPSDHCSFYSQVFRHPFAKDSKIKASEAKLFDVVKLEGSPPMEQKLWPDHCVQGTAGMKLHEDLIEKEGDKYVEKGTNPNIDSYSGFFDNAKLNETGLRAMLQDARINTVFVCGLAYDVCVGSTALHASELGFRTFVVEDACAGVTKEGIEAMKKALFESGCVIVQSSEVPKIMKELNDETSMHFDQLLQQLETAKKQHHVAIEEHQHVCPHVRHQMFVVEESKS